MRRSEPRLRITCTENFVKVGLSRYASGQTNRQPDRQTYTLAAILRQPRPCEVGEMIVMGSRFCNPRNSTELLFYMESHAVCIENCMCFRPIELRGGIKPKDRQIIIYTTVFYHHNMVAWCQTFTSCSNSGIGHVVLPAARLRGRLSVGGSQTWFDSGCGQTFRSFRLRPFNFALIKL